VAKGRPYEIPMIQRRNQKVSSPIKIFGQDIQILPTLKIMI